MFDQQPGRVSVTVVVSTADDSLLLTIDSTIGDLVDNTVSLRSVVSPANQWRTKLTQAGTVIAIVDVSSFEQAREQIEQVNRVSEDAKIVLINRCDAESLEPLVNRVAAIVPYTEVAAVIASVVRLVRLGMIVIPGAIIHHARSEPWLMKGDPDMERLRSLSYTESRVLLSLTEGMSNKHIAKEINISDNTVRVHVRNIFLKLGVQNRTQAALLATRFRYSGILLEKIEPLRAGVV